LLSNIILQHDTKRKGAVAFCIFPSQSPSSLECAVYRLFICKRQSLGSDIYCDKMFRKLRNGVLKSLIQENVLLVAILCIGTTPLSFWNRKSVYLF